MDNMAIYQAVRAVPQEAQKAFNNGSFSGTDINPMWRIKTLTEQFGPCGIGWYYEVLSERAEEHGDQTMAIVDLNLYIKVDGEWSKPIFGTGGNSLLKTTKSGQRASDEGYKMALTDALSVACKALGIGADVYFGADKTKYTQYAAAASEPSEKPLELVLAEKFDSKKAINAWCKHNGLKMSDFGAFRTALIKAEIVEDIPSDQMTAQQVNVLCKAIEKHYPDALQVGA